MTKKPKVFEIEDMKLDLRGERCPFTFIHSKEIIEKLKGGQTLEILIDFPPAIETIGQFCFKHDLKFEFEKVNEHIKLVVKA